MVSSTASTTLPVGRPLYNAASVCAHIDQAILELQRAKAMADKDPAFTVNQLGEARFCIAAARVQIVSAAVPPLPVGARHGA